MSELMYEAITRIARHEGGARTWAQLAVVTEVHTSVLLGDDHAVTVKLRDTGVVVPRVPIAVGALGFVATPAIGDLVLVVFADGDPHGGVVVGSLHHRDLAPPAHDEGQVVLHLPPGESDPPVQLVADPATPQLRVLVGEATIDVTGRAATITIGDAVVEVDGNSPVTINLSTGAASVTLDGNGELSMKASNINIAADGNLVLKGDGKVSISGAMVELN